MEHWLTPFTLSAVVALAVQVVFAVRWLYRRARNDELLRLFVRDMATNHLPHIYHCLRELCRQREIAISEQPAIRWVDLNGKRGS